MHLRENLQNAIADTIWTWSAGRVAAVCERLGLPLQDPDEAPPMSSKRAYANRRLDSLDYGTLMEVGRRLWAETGASHSREAAALGEVLRLIDSPPKVTEFTRRRLAEALDQLPGEVFGSRSTLEVLPAVLPDLDLTEQVVGGLVESIFQHTVRNDDWFMADYFQRFGLMTGSDARLFRFLEQMVHPLSRVEAEQAAYVREVNANIERDGFTLIEAAQMSGFPIYKIVPVGHGVGGRPKNLIFASTGPKPEIVFRVEPRPRFRETRPVVVSGACSAPASRKCWCST